MKPCLLIISEVLESTSMKTFRIVSVASMMIPHHQTLDAQQIQGGKTVSRRVRL
jgi:hypothetical protein